MTDLDVTRDWKTLLALLPADYEALAREHKQLETQYPDAKVHCADDLLRLVFVHAGADLPLRQTVATVAAAGGPNISPNVLHKKMRKAGVYLRALVERMTDWNEEAGPERWAGYEMVAVDATAFAGRTATGTDARAHVAIRLADLSIRSLYVTDGFGGESLKRFYFHAGQLVIGDRGYANPTGIQATVDQGADLLLRVNRGALPLYDRDGQQVDVLATARTLCVDEVLDYDVRVLPGRGSKVRPIGGRLIIHRLPPELADQAREWVHREQGRRATVESLEMAEYVLLFTTAPRGRLTATRCLQAYRLRWQIELLFKRWKSLCGFDRLPNERPDTIESWIYAKVLLALLMDKLGASATELSPPMRLVGPARIDRRRSRMRAFANAAPTRPAAVEGHVNPLASHRRSDPAAPSHHNDRQAARDRHAD
jgi:hypothetical protein